MCAKLMLSIHVNGKPHQVEDGTTVLQLIEGLGLGGRPVAVERNMNVVPKAEHASTQLEDQDKLELVSFVGGG